ncbi:MAG TPA: Spx/MgsR family RNA polymerase-binding regulatory protein [Pusillimonas sp.]|uniref:Spx/MgsR family RNA polymerase-binding regulatory protein n=1 Tax=Pusillimonas sp. TaxID=3040095 RepID=UPI002C4917C2|nr:Spx/MgsR family RNA polymerase-binding regulatory protein [Pusillimonas sp.]HUH88461.1 Spx/MgsR family RNA polymerase-binding regulatory protein [Pusillimonas sp.]
MNTIRLYGLKRCSTCVKAMSWLQEQGIAYEFTDYRDQPVPASTLSDWQAQLGGWEKLVNRASMTWRNLPDERKTPQGDEQWLGLIAEFPALIKRPVRVDADGRVSVGFSAKKYDELKG